MLDYTILKNKPLLHDAATGEEYIDLLPTTMPYGGITDGNIIIVRKEYVARPDLISLAVYGTDKYGDVICKVNGISNPFELNEDMVLMIPPINFVTACYVKPRKASDIVNSTTTIDRQKENNLQKKITDKRTPAQQIEGESNYIIDRSLGVVFY